MITEGPSINPHLRVIPRKFLGLLRHDFMCVHASSHPILPYLTVASPTEHPGDITTATQQCVPWSHIQALHHPQMQLRETPAGTWAGLP